MSGADDLNVALRVGGDASGAAAATDQASAKLDALGNSARRAMASATGGASEAARAVANLVGQIDPVANKFAKLDEQLDSLKKFKSSGAISGDDFVAYADKIEKSRAALAVAGAAQHSFSLNTAATRIELGRLLKDMATGQTERFAQSFTTLTAQTGLLGSALGFLVSPIGLVTVAAGVMIAAFVAGQAEESKLNRTLIETGNYAGTTAVQIESMGSVIGSQTGKVRDSRTALQELAATGRFTGDDLQLVGKAVVDFSTVTGRGIDSAVKEMVKLRDEPVKASLELDKQLHFLTVTIYEQIAAAERNGDTQQASAIAEKALGDAMAERATKITQNLGLVEKAWNGVKSAAQGAWDGMLDIGRQHSVDDQIRDVSVQLADAQGRYMDLRKNPHVISSIFGTTNTDLQIAQDEVAKLQEKLSSLNTQHLQQEASAGAAAIAGLSKQEQEDAVTAQADFDRLTASIDKNAAAQQKIQRAASDLYKVYMGGGKLPAGVSFDGPVADIPVGPGWEKLKSELLANTQGFHDLKAAQKAAAEDMPKLDDLISKLSQDTTPLAQETSRYNTELDQLAKYEADFRDAGRLSADMLDKLQHALDLANQRHQEQIDKIRILNGLRVDEGDSVQRLLTQYDQEEAALTKNSASYSRELEELRAVKEMRAAITQAVQQGNIDRARELESEVSSLEARARGHADYINTLKQEQSLIHDWSQMAEQDLTSFFTAMNHGGSIAKNFGNVMKEVFQQILLEIEKLAVIGPVMNMLFGTNMPTMSTAGGALGMLMGNNGGGGSFGGSGSILNTAAQAFSGNSSDTTGGGSSFSLFSPSTWLGAGRSLFGGAGAGLTVDTAGIGAGTPAATMFGDGGGTGIFAGANAGGATSFNAGFWGNGASSYGGMLGIAGGIYAGYNEYQAAGGGVAGLAGGAAYGVGTAVLAGAASTALSAGLAAGLASIPVVGWIALAAMAINMVSGGKLFGTAGKPIGGNEVETIGPNGATVSAEMTYKGQHALFGGSYYKEHNVPVDPAAQQAATDFYNALVEGRNAFADEFGVHMGDIVGGSFDTQFDKHGKQTGTSDTVLGQTYKNETQQQFAERLQADNYLAVLDTMGVAASKFVSGVQGDADKLFAAVQGMAQAAEAAQKDIKGHNGLLGDSGTVADVLNLTIKLNTSNEALSATYARLQQESQTLQSGLDYAALSAGKTAEQMVIFADDAAKAAGGAQQLAQLTQSFNQDYYTAGQQSAQSISKLRDRVASEGAAIGQDPNETAQQFKANFEAALPTLTPEDLVAWKEFGVDLFSLNQQVASAADNYAQFIAQFSPTPLSQAEQAFINVEKSLTANINKANDLAKANGMAGASAADIGKIIASSVMQGVQALRTLETEATQLVTSLFGSKSDFYNQVGWLDPNAAQNQQQQQASQQFLQAATLLGDLGQIGAVTGETLQDFSKRLGIPLDKLAALLGTDSKGLGDQFKVQEDMAKAALDTAGNTKYTNELLANILAASQGKPLPFSTEQLSADATGSLTVATLSPNGTNKIGNGHIVHGPSTPQGDGGSVVVANAVTQGNASLLDRLDDLIEAVYSLGKGPDRPMSVVPRSNRPVRVR